MIALEAETAFRVACTNDFSQGFDAWSFCSGTDLCRDCRRCRICMYYGVTYRCWMTICTKALDRVSALVIDLPETAGAPPRCFVTLGRDSASTNPTITPIETFYKQK